MVEMLYAYSDTTGLEVYNSPGKYYGNWQEAGEAEKEAVMHQRFLKGELVRRGGERARAKRFVIPQRERYAEEESDPVIREVSSNTLCTFLNRQ